MAKFKLFSLLAQYWSSWLKNLRSCDPPPYNASNQNFTIKERKANAKTLRSAHSSGHKVTGPVGDENGGGIHLNPDIQGLIYHYGRKKIFDSNAEIRVTGYGGIEYGTVTEGRFFVWADVTFRGGKESTPVVFTSVHAYESSNGAMDVIPLDELENFGSPMKAQATSPVCKPRPISGIENCSNYAPLVFTDFSVTPFIFTEG